MNNSKSARVKSNLATHILLMCVWQTAFAAEDGRTPNELEEIDPPTGVKIIIIDAKKWSEPAEAKEAPDCEINDTNIHEKLTIESAVDLNRYRSRSRACIDAIEADAYAESASEATHNFALDPFGFGEVFKGSSIEYVLEHFGLPDKIDIRPVQPEQFSRFAPVDYLYPGLKITFGYESAWVGTAGIIPAYEPFTVVDAVQGLIITSSDVELRDGMHVGMKWNDVLTKLGNPIYGYKYESNIINFDTIIFEFEVDNSMTVTKIMWPVIRGH